jgi:hypothetical protein
VCFVNIRLKIRKQRQITSIYIITNLQIHVLLTGNVTHFMVKHHIKTKLHFSLPSKTMHIVTKLLAMYTIVYLVISYTFVYHVISYYPFLLTGNRLQNATEGRIVTNAYLFWLAIDICVVACF